MTNKVVTLGEIMLRLSPPGHRRIVQTEMFNVNYGGAEANVAVMLGALGLKPSFVTQLPDNAVAQGAVNYLRSYGVNTDHIARKGKRMGIYYFEKGTSIRPSRVIYDRADSAMSAVDVDDFDLDEIFKNADWFHFSGITAALGTNCIELLKKSIEAARRNNVKISVDLNYRKQLWAYDEFEKAMTPLIKNVDLCIGWLNSNNEEYNVADFSKNAVDLDYMEKVLGNMTEKFNIKNVATTLREGFSSSHNALSAVMHDGTKLHVSKRYEFDIVDRVGAGDSFAGGLIYKLVKGCGASEALEFAMAAAALKHAIEGDAAIASEDEIMDMVKGEALGAVKR